TIADPLLREAIEVDGFEETRHKQVLSNLVAAYGIRLAPEPDYVPPRHPEWAFLLAGFSECVDTFFAFGLFALAKRSGFFPPSLVDTFEPVVQEEGRHILFFVNWLVWHRRKLPPWRRALFILKIFSAWAFLIWERIDVARGIGKSTAREPTAGLQDNNFVFTGSKAIGGVGASAAAVIDVCLSEHERRFSGYDERLLRPQLMPRLMRFARRFMRD
ncbi:MAG: ferritin-like domain-containing protein, partial [Stellaceae bacterium]